MPTRNAWGFPPICVLLLCVFLGGCTGGKNPSDPWEPTNRFFYDLNDGLDRVALKPMADLYTNAVPKEVRTGIGNGFDNLGYANVILNDLLQGQWEQAAGDAGRMALNSTVGIAGVFDVATPCGLPAHENDFGLTLGKWGVEPGPYMVLPLFGPSTVRDVPGIGVGMVTDPVFWVNPPLYVTIPLYTTQAVNARSRYEKMFRFRNQAALDPYVFTRSAYLQYRAAKIHGEKPGSVDEDLYDDEFGPGTTPPATVPATGPSAGSPGR